MGRTINHRELRNNSSQVLRDVKAGETIEVTNGGEPAAVLVPPGTKRLTSRSRNLSAEPLRLPTVLATETVADTMAALRDDR